VRGRGRLFAWDQVRADNAEEYPNPVLPTYENSPEWVDGEYVTRHVSVPVANIDYIKNTIAGSDVDPATIQVLP